MIRFLCSAKTKNSFPVTQQEIVFVGRSNVGKSSLLNALYQQKLAYTGKTPGKTRLINFFDIHGKYTAVDVPGYGYARRSDKELIEFGQMMDDYFSRKDKIKLVVMIVDSRIGFTADDLDMLEYLKDSELPYVIVANKIDKLSNNQLAKNKKEFFQEQDNIIYVSCLKKTNIDLLEKAICSYLEVD
ncbi:MAG: YihA family ribosome biogenesis GTP-binding protein [Erysipelotrichaceae bacterium]|nr:YihA family ribosome biogenesis GTP-binding protein [Erysipelotrichaceae bacterium]